MVPAELEVEIWERELKSGLQSSKSSAKLAGPAHVSNARRIEDG
jgi:hypothetical protein